MGVNVSGYNGMSAIRMTVKGTSTNHLHAHTVDIIYNHYKDVFVKSWSGAYSTLYLKIVGNSSEDFDIFFKSSTGSVSPALAADLIITIEPLTGARSDGTAEYISFTTTSQNYTGGATHEHACTPGGYNQTATDGSTTGHAHMRMDGNLTVSGTGTSTFAGTMGISKSAESLLEITNTNTASNQYAYINLKSMAGSSTHGAGLRFMGPSGGSSSQGSIIWMDNDELVFETSCNNPGNAERFRIGDSLATFAGSTYHTGQGGFYSGQDAVYLNVDGGNKVYLGIRQSDYIFWHIGLEASNTTLRFRSGNVGSDVDRFTLTTAGNATFTGNVTAGDKITINNSGDYPALNVNQSDNDGYGINVICTNANYVGRGIQAAATRAASSVFRLFTGQANSVDMFYVRGDGAFYTAGAAIFASTVQVNLNLRTGSGTTHGNASDPGITTLGDTNTGIYFPGSGIVGIGGTGGLQVENGITATTATFTGNVSIASTKTLHIGAGDGVGILNVRQPSGTENLRQIVIDTGSTLQDWSFGTDQEGNYVDFILSSEYGNNSWTDYLRISKQTGAATFSGLLYSGNQVIKDTASTYSALIIEGNSGKDAKLLLKSNAGAANEHWWQFEALNADTTLRIRNGNTYLHTFESGGNVTFGGDVLPSANNTKDLGSSTYRWANVYAGDLHLKNEVGDWTVEEGEEELFLHNNKTGKKFAIMMREVE